MYHLRFGHAATGVAIKLTGKFSCLSLSLTLHCPLRSFMMDGGCCQALDFFHCIEKGVLNVLP